MYIKQTSFLSRLLGAAWTILLICVLLWLAICLLAKIWVWIVVLIGAVTLVRVGFLWRRLRRDWW